MKTRMISAVLALLLFAPVMSSRAEAALTVPITQTIGGIGTFTGQLAVNRFAVVNGQLAVIGTLTGQIRDTLGNLLGTVATTVTVPAAISGSCDILHLTLGPLDLDLLGLQVHLDRIVLDITAQSGPGNLLGNLLCAVANLLNGGGPLQQIVAALNQLLSNL